MVLNLCVNTCKVNAQTKFDHEWYALGKDDSFNTVSTDKYMFISMYMQIKLRTTGNCLVL